LCFIAGLIGLPVAPHIVSNLAVANFIQTVAIASAIISVGLIMSVGWAYLITACFIENIRGRVSDSEKHWGFVGLAVGLFGHYALHSLEACWGCFLASLICQAFAAVLTVIGLNIAEFSYT